jgi:hypothetical protein
MSAPFIPPAATAQTRDRISARSPLRVWAHTTACDLPDIGPQARREWLEELQRYQRDCGCGVGGIGAVAVLVPVMAWQIASITTLSLISAAAALVEVVVLTAVGGVVGKLIGLGRARLRFRRATARLLAEHGSASDQKSSPPLAHSVVGQF